MASASVRAGRPTLTILKGPTVGRSFVIDRPVVVIGRDLACDFVLDAISVSRQHARVVSKPDGLVVEDLGSTQGTRINGRPVEGPTPLNDGDKVFMGECLLAFSAKAQLAGDRGEETTTILGLRDASTTGEWALVNVRPEEKLRAILGDQPRPGRHARLGGRARQGPDRHVPPLPPGRAGVRPVARRGTRRAGHPRDQDEEARPVQPDPEPHGAPPGDGRGQGGADRGPPGRPPVRRFPQRRRGRGEDIDVRPDSRPHAEAGRRDPDRHQRPPRAVHGRGPGPPRRRGRAGEPDHRQRQALQGGREEALRRPRPRRRR